MSLYENASDFKGVFNSKQFVHNEGVYCCIDMKFRIDY